MSHIIRRPILSSVGLFSGRTESRCFSATPLHRATPRKPRNPTSQQPRQQTQPSVKVLARKGDGAKMSHDMGLLPGMFVHPSSKNRPSPFSRPGAALSLQWTRLKRKAQDIVMILIYKWTGQVTPRPKLRLRAMVQTAKDLHKEMYTAFADGNSAALQKICVDGLRESFMARIGMRNSREQVQWELVRYNGRAKTMAHRATVLPIDGMALRQAVVKISSRQRLSRFRDGVLVQGTGVEKDVIEYLVIQRLVKNREEQEWRVWGTTGETTYEKVQREKIEALL